MYTYWKELSRDEKKDAIFFFIACALAGSVFTLILLAAK